MLKCKQVTERAGAYLDGELTTLQRLEFRLHLLMCRHCHRFMHNFQAGIAMIRRAPRPRADDALLDAIDKRIRELDQ